MKRAAKMIIGALALVAPAPVIAADNTNTAHLYGPAPSWDEFSLIAEANIASRLIDPDSARITWLGQYSKGEWKPFLLPRVYGYVACGLVNARNRMGGYAGAVTFVVVIDYGRVLFAELDSRAGGFISQGCGKARAEGLMPPLPPPSSMASSSPSSPASAPANASGLTLRVMPEGAYVASVTPGGRAAAAGLTPGMVITSVNGIALSGMGEAMTRVIDAAPPGATLAVVGGRTLTLGAKP